MGTTIFETLRCPRCGTTPLAVARVRSPGGPKLTFDCHACGHDTVLTLAEFLARQDEEAAVA